MYKRIDKRYNNREKKGLDLIPGVFFSSLFSSCQMMFMIFYTKQNGSYRDLLCVCFTLLCTFSSSSSSSYA